MRLLRATLENGSTHWINPAIYDGLEFIKDGDSGNGSVLCHYRDGNGRTSFYTRAKDVELLASEYERILRGEYP